MSNKQFIFTGTVAISLCQINNLFHRNSSDIFVSNNYGDRTLCYEQISDLPERLPQATQCAVMCHKFALLGLSRLCGPLCGARHDQSTFAHWSCSSFSGVHSGDLLRHCSGSVHPFSFLANTAFHYIPVINQRIVSFKSAVVL